MQWGFASEWSHEIAVQPDGGIAPEVPTVYGALQNEKDLLIHLQPVKKATGYRLKLKHKDTGVEQLLPIQKLNLNICLSKD